MPRAMHNRVRRLETSSIQPDYCATCGAPDTVALRVVVTRHTDPLPRCTGCGRHLDEDGRPLPKVYKRFILPDGDPTKDAAPPGAGDG